MLNKLKRIFYTSFLGNLYFNFLLWNDHRKFKKDLKSVKHTTINFTINQNQVKYEEGLNRVKTKIADLTKTQTKEEYEKVLDNVKELINFAQNENREEIEAMRKAFVYKETDIKSDLDKAKMVERRINDYKDLWKHKEQREKLRQLRKKNG